VSKATETTEYGECPACGESVPVNARGTLQTHTPGPLTAGVTPKEMCSGSGVAATGDGRQRMCPACMSMVVVDADGVLAEHDTGTSVPSRCVGSGWTIKGEHQ
jgi:hypothetical protein